MRGGRGDMDREAQQIDHQRHVDDAAADAEDARDKADAETRDDADPLAELEPLRNLMDVCGWPMGRIPEHDAGHAEHEQAVVEVELRRAEGVDDIRAHEGARQRGSRERYRRMEEDAFLPDIGEGTRCGIGEHDDQRGARDLGCRMEIRIDAAIGQEEDEDRHADKAAADAHEGAEDADEQAEQQE